MLYELILLIFQWFEVGSLLVFSLYAIGMQVGIIVVVFWWGSFIGLGLSLCFAKVWF